MVAAFFHRRVVKLAKETDASASVVFVCDVVPSSLVSLSQSTAKAGYLERLMRLMVAGSEERVLALHTEVTTSALVKLATDDESTSIVVVNEMVRRRLPVTNCGEQCSPVLLSEPTLKAGYMEKVPTDNVQGVVCYGKLTGEIDEPAPDVVV